MARLTVPQGIPVIPARHRAIPLRRAPLPVHRILPCVIAENPNCRPCNDLRVLLHVEPQKIDKRIATMKSSREIPSRYLDDLD